METLVNNKLTDEILLNYVMYDNSLVLLNDDFKRELIKYNVYTRTYYFILEIYRRINDPRISAFFLRKNNDNKHLTYYYTLNVVYCYKFFTTHNYVKLIKDGNKTYYKWIADKPDEKLIKQIINDANFYVQKRNHLKNEIFFSLDNLNDTEDVKIGIIFNKILPLKYNMLLNGFYLTLNKLKVKNDKYYTINKFFDIDPNDIKTYKGYKFFKNNDYINLESLLNINVVKFLNGTLKQKSYMYVGKTDFDIYYVVKLQNLCIISTLLKNNEKLDSIFLNYYNNNINNTTSNNSTSINDNILTEFKPEEKEMVEIKPEKKEVQKNNNLSFSEGFQIMEQFNSKIDDIKPILDLFVSLLNNDNVTKLTDALNENTKVNEKLISKIDSLNGDIADNIATIKEINSNNAKFINNIKKFIKITKPLNPNEVVSKLDEAISY